MEAILSCTLVGSWSRLERSGAVRISRTSVVREEFSRTTDGEEATREGFSGATVGLSTTESWGWLVSCSWESWFQG